MHKLQEFLKIINGDRVTIKISNSNYLKLLEHENGVEEYTSNLANRLISDYFDTLEENYTLSLEKKEKEEELLNSYFFLDDFLNATLDNTIQIGITNELIGSEGPKDNYTLLKYEISPTYKYLSLVLRNEYREYPISFNNIKDIKFIHCGDNILKTWIYMPNNTWRFYLEYDKNKLKNGNKNILSNEGLNL